METKSKRKYTKKVQFKEDVKEVKESITEPEPVASPAPIDQLDLAIKRLDIFRSSMRQIHSNPTVYIYHVGGHIDTVKYIYDLQQILEGYNVKSQVVFLTDKIDNPGIQSCFTTQDEPAHWTDYFGRNKGVCLKIIERPRIEPQDLYEVMCKKEEVINDFYEIKMEL